MLLCVYVLDITPRKSETNYSNILCGLNLQSTTLTLMLLVATFANTKLFKNPEKSSLKHRYTLYEFLIIIVFLITISSDQYFPSEIFFKFRFSKKSHGYSRVLFCCFRYKCYGTGSLIQVHVIIKAVSGEFPKLWKLAHVVPVHKKESTQDPLNYRPVSLLTCISKIFEKLVFNHVYQYLDHFHLLSPKQSGFRPGDSTVNQLCFITHSIYESLQNGKEVRAVFIDLSRAFDKS